MNTTCRISILLATAALAGCAGYGFPTSAGGYGNPGAGGYGYPPDGYGYPPNDRYPGPGGYGGTLRCESDNERTRRCRADTRGGVRITRQLSNAACIRGRTWGYDNSGIWVTRGCRAEFVVGRGGGYGPGTDPGYGQIVRCESEDRRQRRCNIRVRHGVEIIRQLSDTRCVQRQNWGWDRGGIWVRGGCRAEFRVR